MPPAARSTGRRREGEAPRAALRTWSSRLRQRREQMAKAQSRLAHVQPLLNFPHASRHRVHDRDLQVPLQRLDDVERAPAGAEDVDRVGAFRLEEITLDVGIDLMAR